jgi:hypothetical protein
MLITKINFNNKSGTRRSFCMFTTNAESKGIRPGGTIETRTVVRRNGGRELLHPSEYRYVGIWGQMVALKDGDTYDI